MADVYAIRGFCDTCGAEMRGMHRLPQVIRYHGRCGKESVIRYRKNGKVVPIAEMPKRWIAQHGLYHKGD